MARGLDQRCPRSISVKPSKAEATPTREKRAAMDMDRFFNDQHIDRYRRLASAATTEAERKVLLDLLAEERNKWKKAR
jgi:hypothetical protein